MTEDYLQLNCEQCNKTNSSEKGLTQHMWIKQLPSKDFIHYHFDYCRQVYKRNTLKLRTRKKCEKCTMKCNMENVPKGHFIQSILINIWTGNSKYHTTTDHYRRNLKSHARDNININALCEREVLSRNHSKRHSKTISE